MGRSAGDKSVEAFDAFVAARERQNDWADYVTPDRSRLRRGEVSKACGFSRSVLLQNKVAAGRLLMLENDLRRRSILKGSNEERRGEYLELMTDRDQRVRNVEDRTGALESAVGTLRRSVEEVGQQIDKILSG
jgi:hypothetical protein